MTLASNFWSLQQCTHYWGCVKAASLPPGYSLPLHSPNTQHPCGSPYGRIWPYQPAKDTHMALRSICNACTQCNNCCLCQANQHTQLYTNMRYISLKQKTRTQKAVTITTALGEPSLRMCTPNDHTLTQPKLVAITCSHPHTLLQWPYVQSAFV